MTAPLSHYRVLDWTAEPGAFCGKLLADLGADVIKMEPPDGDPTRRLGPFMDGKPHPEGSLRFASLNTNKRGITLDPATPAGRQLFFHLLARADVLLEDLPAGRMDALGLDRTALLGANPELVHTSVTGFGLSGPHSSYLAPDIVVFAMSGLLGISGEPDGTPCTAPETQAYYAACLYAALGTLIALHGGGPEHVEIAAQDCLACEEHQISRYSMDGHIVRREGSQHGSATPGRIFPAKDGYIHMFVSGAWPQFFEWIGRPEALSDEVWSDGRFRRENVDVVNPFANEFCARFEKNALAEEGQSRHIPIVPVNAPNDLAEDPQLKALEFFQEAPHPYLGTARYTGAPYRFGGAALPLFRPTPLLGEHNEQIYAEVSVSHSDMAVLRANGVI